MAWPNHKPPTNGPEKGSGWGGPAKGSGNGSPGVARDPSLRTPGSRLLDPPEVTEAARLKREERERKIAALKDELYRLSTQAANEHARIAAITAYLDREEGKPVQRVVSSEVEDTRLVINVMTDFRDDD